MSQLNVTAAFAAGLISFFSPCFIPLIPAYLSFISGVAVLDKGELPRYSRIRVFLSALFFVIGFSLIFVLLGASAGALGRVLLPYRTMVIRISGIIIIVFGLYMVGFFRLFGIPYLRYFNLDRMRISGYLGSFFIGMAFSFAYVPCIGPILGSILVLAANTGTVVTGASLLLIYSIGLAVPFLTVAAAVSALAPVLKRLNKAAGIIQYVGGAMLVLFGILTTTGLLEKLTLLVK